jgi:triacylglycerol lipase
MLVSEDRSSTSWKSVPLMLSAIAYCITNEIESDLQQYLPNWTMVWAADKEIDGNFAYIAYNAKVNQYCVAIRGSVLSFTLEAFDDWFEQDFDVLVQSDWHFPTGKGIKTSGGADKGLKHLQEMVCTQNGQKTTMWQFLKANLSQKKAALAVTGHSLGGGLATVCALWLNYEIENSNVGSPPMTVVTFAAPSVGNQPFADAFDAAFGDSSLRYYNSIDIVPMASASIADIAFLYSPAPKASNISATIDGFTGTLQELIIALAAGVEASEYVYSSYYTQTNQTKGSVELNPQRKLCNFLNESALYQWFDQAGCHHGLASYFYWVSDGKDKPPKCTASLFSTETCIEVSSE